MFEISTSVSSDAVVSVPATLAEPLTAIREAEVRAISGARTRVGLVGRVALGLALGVAAGLATAMLLGGVPWPALAVTLAVWSIATCSALTTRGLSRGQGVRLSLTRGLWSCCAVAVAAVVLAAGVETARGCLAAAVAATAATSLSVALGSQRQRERRVVLVGNRDDVEALAARIGESDGLRVVGACVPRVGPSIPIQSPLRVPTSFQVSAVPGLAERLEADCVLAVPGPTLGSEDVRRLAWSLERGPVSLHLAWGFDWVARHRVRIGRLGTSQVLDLEPTRRRAPARVAKCLLDRALGLLLLVGAAPALAAMWIAVRLESSGPGFFRQTRVGLDGRHFTMYKMRTMCADAEARKESLQDLNHVDETLFKIRADPRVTRVGAILRRTSLDELPQLLNVVRGEMSLIGPRPALPDEVAAYHEDARRRMAVKPGMTGLWQVSGRSDLSWDESIGLDLHYADNWRLLDDLVIAAKTVSAVTRARGAY